MSARAISRPATSDVLVVGAPAAATALFTGLSAR